MFHRRWTAPHLAVASLALVACAPDPPTGTWLFVDGEVVTNTCNNADVDIASGNFALYNNGNGTFTVDPEDGSDPFLCTQDAADFVCPQRLQGSYNILGAVIEVRVDIRGTFDSDTFAAGTQRAEGSCSGAACGLTGIDFPCVIEETFTASFKG